MQVKLDRATIGYSGKVIARDLTAVLPAGSVTALVGSNGCGKSTLLRTIAGLQPSLGGSITPKPDARNLAVVLTDRIDVPALTVNDVVALGRLPYMGLAARLSAVDRTTIAHAMEMAGIAHLSLRRIGELSDGERQRAMIARAVAQDTPIILLDEPTAFLDFPSKVDTLKLLCRLAHEEGKTILLSTHDLEIAFQLADRLWLLSDDGISEGSAEELAACGAISAIFPHIKFDSNTLRFIL